MPSNHHAGFSCEWVRHAQVIEAMTCGLPTFATNRGGPAEIIEDGKSGATSPARIISAIRPCSQWL
jgi:glycosyltransferase involved in cell wall biosynthesis